MQMRLLIIVIGGLCLADAGRGSIIFRPGEKVKYVAPGEEEISGNAQQLFEKAQEAEKQGNFGRAIKAYTHLLRKYPKDTLAPGATYRAAQLL
jgi:TolA-binding protein